MNKKELRSLHIDVENGIYQLNEMDISKSVSRLELVFEDGIWSLMVTEDSIYTTNDHAIKE